MRAASSFEVEHRVEIQVSSGGWQTVERRPMRDFSWGQQVADLESRGWRVRVTRGVRRPRQVYVTQYAKTA